MKCRKGALLVAGLSLPLAEVGHALAYGLHVPAVGAHRFFPLMLQAAGALLGGSLLLALGVIVLARLLSGAVARRQAWSFSLLAAGLLTGQILVFLVQEYLESGFWPDSTRLVLGLLAQQPVAFLAALALRWLSARMGPAVRALVTLRPPALTLPALPRLTPAPVFTAARYRAAEPRPLNRTRAPPA